MFRKGCLVLILILLICATPGYSQEIKTPEPYTEEEFPQWALDLRRFEVVMIGSLPLSLLYTSLGYSIIRFGVNGFDPAYAPSLQQEAETIPMTSEERIGMVITGIGISAAIAIADQIIIHIKRQNELDKTTPTSNDAGD